MQLCFATVSSAYDAAYDAAHGSAYPHLPCCILTPRFPLAMLRLAAQRTQSCSFLLNHTSILFITFLTLLCTSTNFLLIGSEYLLLFVCSVVMASVEVPIGGNAVEADSVGKSLKKIAGYYVFRAEYLAAYRTAHPDEKFQSRMLFPAAKRAFKNLSDVERQVSKILS